MTVAELINELKKHDGKRRVFVSAALSGNWRNDQDVLEVGRTFSDDPDGEVCILAGFRKKKDNADETV